MPNGITRETFKDADHDTKMLILFDLQSQSTKILADHVEEQKRSCERRSGECDRRFLKIERRKVIDTTVSAISGFVGGAGAVMAKWFFWKGGGA